MARCSLIEREQLECNGGEGCCIYKQPDTVPSFDKGGHMLRSLANSPVHRKHWAKEEREIAELTAQIKALARANQS